MTLPRSSRRSAASWAINVATLAVLMSSVWMSAQQRVPASSHLSTTPASTESATRPPVAPDLVTAAHITAGNAGAVALTSSALDGDALQRVGYTVKR